MQCSPRRAFQSLLVLVASSLCGTSAALSSEPSLDVALVSRALLPHLLHVYNTTLTGTAAAAWKHAIGRATSSGACQRPGAVAVILDIGFGHLTLSVAEAASHLRIVAWAPSNGAGLAPRLEASVAHAGLLHRVAIARSSADASRSIGRGPRACAVILDWLPRVSDVTRMHVAALADLVVAGIIDSETRVLPAAARVHVAALRCPQLARLSAVSPAATLGVDMLAAFPLSDAPGPDFWAADRPTSAASVGCGKSIRWEARSTATMYFAAAAVAAARGRPMPMAALSIPLTRTAQVDAISMWHDIVLDEVANIYSPLSHLQDGSSEPHGAVISPVDLARHIYGDVLVPVPRLRQASFSDELAVEVVFSQSFTLYAAPRLEGARAAVAMRPATGFAVWHISMLNDVQRNAAYGAAIAAAVATHARTAPPNVIELGAGAGLLAVLAARAGAGAVYAIEASADMQPRLRATIIANGVADVVHVLPCHSTEVWVEGVSESGKAALSVDVHGKTHFPGVRCPVPLPHRADILVHEIFDYSVTGEGVFPSVADALRRLIVQSGSGTGRAPTVIPARLVVHAMAVESEELGALYDADAFLRPGSPLMHIEGLSHLPLHDATIPVDLGAVQHADLTPALKLWEIDFGSIAEVEALLGAQVGQAFGPPVSLPVVKRGRVDAVVSWFVLEFGERARGGAEGGDRPASCASHDPQCAPPSPFYSTSPSDMPNALHWFQMAELPLWGESRTNTSNRRAHHHTGSRADLSDISHARGPLVSPGDAIVLQPHPEPGAGGFSGLRSWATLVRAPP